MSTTPAPKDHRALLLEALQAVEKLKGKLRAAEDAGREPIAIVGAACRFPGANTLDDYWTVLAEGKDMVREIPPERWGSQGVPKQAAVWHAGLIDGLDQFDPRMFNIAPREANTMDPQQRMVLEIAWDALENAGQNPHALAGSATGVFLGITSRDYGELIREQGLSLMDIYTATGNASNVAPGRLSFVLGLQGPSVAIDTACSSSLVAIHLACQSLRTRECRMAISGGVNTVLTPGPFVCFHDWGMMAADGRCKTFDAKADGFVRGEGCGLVVLKRLSDAVADGDRIWAVIRGSAVNQDGRSSGLTVPNGPAQEAVIQQALDRAGVQGREIGYVEAHGTGTSMGDPIEGHSLAAVLGVGRPTEDPLVVGSVKTNLGHLESASGVAGLIKVVLSMQHEWIPQHLHFETLNPHIDWKGVPVEIPVKGKAWKRGAKRRLAGVSSFGFSGTNAHIVLEEGEPEGTKKAAEGPRVVVLSARTETALKALSGSWAEHLKLHGDTQLGDVSRTANTGRAHFAQRAAVVANSVEQLREKLEALSKVESKAGVQRRTKIAFLFSGQGSQYAGMGRDLYEREEVFRKALDECGRLLEGELNVALTDLLWGSASHLLDETAYTQPALFALEWAQAEQWRSWGVEPAILLGHSVGEYVAACVAGSCTLQEGIRLIAARGRRMGQMPKGEGAMAAILGPAEPVWKEVEKRRTKVSVAAVNGPESLVVAGYQAAVEEVAAEMSRQGYRVERLKVSHGFHSPQMDGMVEWFGKEAGKIAWKRPRRTVVSSVSGEVLGTEWGGSYWGRQVREPVAFRRAMETVTAQGANVMVEIGPGTTLLGMGRQTVKTDGTVWAPSMRRGFVDSEQMMESLGALYVAGVPIDWSGYEKQRGGRVISLPTYPFERQRYWIEDAAPAVRQRIAKAGSHPLLGEHVELAGTPVTHLWQTELDLASVPWIADHKVQGGAVLPATAYIEMASEGAAQAFGSVGTRVRDAKFHKPMFFVADAIRTIQARLYATSAQSGRFEVYSRPTGPTIGWLLHMSATVETVSVPATQVVPARPVLDRPDIAAEEFYGRFAELGNDWGPAFQGVARARVGPTEGWSEVVAPASIAGEIANYRFHPALADACGHVLAAIRTFATDGSAAPEALVGQSVGDVSIYARPKGKILDCRAWIRPGSNPNELHGDVSVYDEDGTLLSELRGAVLRYLEEESDTAVDAPVEDWMHSVAWHPVDIEHSDKRPDGTWIIVAEPGAAGSDLVARIQADGFRCLRHETDAPLSLEQLGALQEPLQIVYLRGLAASSPGQSAMLTRSTRCWDVVRLIREAASFPSARFYIVTQGAQTLADDDATKEGFWQAPLWGLGRTLSFEYPDQWGGLIDLDPGANQASNAEMLWHWLRAKGGEDQVAIRKGKLLAARLERTRVIAKPPLALRPDSAYLITGGFGGLGFEVARMLASSGARHLVLVSRTPLPPRSKWSELPTGSERSRMAKGVRELEALGASVHAAALDVADADAVRNFANEYCREERPSIRGVVHTAGVLSHNPIDTVPEEEFEAVLRPKLGAWNLHSALETPLDFFVLFSSASAVIASPRLGAYAAANAFLDGLAAHRHRQGLAALSVNWGVWTEAGMAAKFDASGVQSLGERGMGGMKTSEGLDALSRLMASDAANMAVLPVNWAKWAKSYPAYTRLPLFLELIKSQVAPEQSSATVSAGDLLRSITDLQQRIEQAEGYLQSTLTEVTGFPKSEIVRTLRTTELGMDSLMALEVKNRVHRETGVALPIVRFLEGRTVAELAEELAGRITTEAVSAKDRAAIELSDEELLARIDELSEAEIDAALQRLLAEESAL